MGRAVSDHFASITATSNPSPLDRPSHGQATGMQAARATALAEMDRNIPTPMTDGNFMLLAWP